jgi:hypothetical protein
MILYEFYKFNNLFMKTKIDKSNFTRYTVVDIGRFPSIQTSDSLQYLINNNIKPPNIPITKKTFDKKFNECLELIKNYPKSIKP